MPPMIGQISLFPYDFAPRSYMFCDGTLLPIDDNFDLFRLLGNTYGGDQNNFALPNLKAAAPPNLQYCMSLSGDFPTDNVSYNALLGETMLAPPKLAARNMMPAAGQSLLQSQYQVLNAYMGTRFGGDAQHFSLPDVRSRAPHGVQYLIAVQGDLPERLRSREPFLGEILLLPYQRPTETLWICDGRRVSIAQNTALFTLLGIRFGGDGRNIFELPNLTSAAPTGYSYYILGRDGVYPPRA